MKKSVCRMSIILGLVFIFPVISLTQKRTVASQDQDSFPGEYCWRLAPFIDTLKVTVQKEGECCIFSGRWMASNLYSIAIVGSVVRDDVDGRYDFMFTGSDQLDFGNIWHFHAKLRNDMTGNWTFSRDDDFTNSGTMVPVDCTAEMAMNGPAANDPF